MRILLSTDAVGGVGDYAATLARELAARGHDVLVAVLGEPGEELRAAFPAGAELVSRPFRLEWMPDSAADVAASSAWLRDEACRWRAELVHLNQLALAAADYPAPTLVVAHSDVLSWFEEVRKAPAPPEWEGYREVVREGLAAAAVVVAPTEYQSALMRRHYGRGADRVIHNGVRIPTGNPLRAEPLLLSVGRAWDDAKGMATFDRAVGLLGAGAPPAHLLGEEAGPAGERFDAEHLVRHGRSGRLAVDRWMGAATAYVGASLYEPFGLAPLEAALHGCALVLSDIGSFRELWDGCAEFFPPGDHGALAERLAFVHARPDLWRTMGLAARERAVGRYSAERFVERYVALYREMTRA